MNEPFNRLKRALMWFGMAIYGLGFVVPFIYQPKPSALFAFFMVGVGLMILSFAIIWHHEPFLFSNLKDSIAEYFSDFD